MATVVNELVTILRYQVKKSGLDEYVKQARKGAEMVRTEARRAMDGFREGIAEANLEIDRTPSKLGAVRDGFVEANNEIDKTPRKLDVANKATNRLRSTALSLVKAYAGLKGVKFFIRSSTQARQVNQRLRQAIGSAKEFAQVHEQLTHGAKVADTTLEALSGRYITLRNALAASGQDVEKAADLATALSALGTVSGVGGDGYISKFASMLQKGAADASRLRQLLRQSSAMQDYLVKGLRKVNPELGATSANILQLAEDGEISAKQMTDAILSQQKAIAADAAKVPGDIHMAFARVGESFGQLFAKADEQLQIVDRITGAIDFLGDHVKEVTVIVGAFAAAWAFGKTVSGISSLVEGIGKVRGALKAMGGLSDIVGGFASWVGGGPILAIAGAAVLAAVGAYQAFKHWGEIKSFFGKIKDTAAEAMKAIGESIGNAFDGVGGMILSAFTDGFRAVVDYIKNAWKVHVVDAISGVFDKAASKVGSILSGIFGEENTVTIDKDFLEQAAAGKNPYAGTAANMAKLQQRGGNSTSTDNRVMQSNNRFTTNVTVQGGSTARETANRIGQRLRHVQAGYFTPNVEAMP